MANLEQFQAKVCLTAAGCLVQGDRVLLIKHKKLGLWLNPGGHLEENEMPHQTAEREFWEETGIKVKAIKDPSLPNSVDTEYLPNPILSNLHWVCKENYEGRLADPKNYVPPEKWKRGCEQHISLLYLVEPVGEANPHQNIEETDGIEWFSEKDIDAADLTDNIYFEVQTAFRIAKQFAKKK